MAELHPTKIRMGVYAPTQALETEKATGTTSGFAYRPNRDSSCTVTIGARVEQVDEPRTVFIFELEAYPEPKILSTDDLKRLYEEIRSYKRV